jgi:hypothetical protein
MWKKVAIGLIFSWVVTISYAGYKFKYGNTKKVDNRVEIILAAPERDLVLGEMRLLLEGLQGIISGLSNSDFKKVEVSARGNGMIMAQDVNPALMLKLPIEFKSVGMGVHKAFDDLADNIDGKDSKDILSELDSIMDSCVGCHATYKLETAR